MAASTLSPLSSGAPAGSSIEARSTPCRYSSISTISRAGVSAMAHTHSGNSSV